MARTTHNKLSLTILSNLRQQGAPLVAIMQKKASEARAKAASYSTAVAQGWSAVFEWDKQAKRENDYADCVDFALAAYATEQGATK